MRETSDGSSASYYELPERAKELQDLISYRNMNAQDGEMFRSLYRKGLASHSDELRDAKKILFYAQAEVARLENQGQVITKHYSFVSETVLPPVETPLIILREGEVIRVERDGYIADKSDDMRYLTPTGEIIIGRFPWTYP